MIAALDFTDERSAQTRKPARATTMPAPKRSYEYHEPVLLAETMELLAPAPGRLFVDGTLGGGGHTAALLARGARVIGLDQDADAIAFATARLGDADENFRAVRSSFALVGEVLDGLGIAQIDGGALLRAVMAEASARGAERIHLEVRSGNDALELYRREGFDTLLDAGWGLWMGRRC